MRVRGSESTVSLVARGGEGESSISIMGAASRSAPSMRCNMSSCERPTNPREIAGDVWNDIDGAPSDPITFENLMKNAMKALM